MDEHNFSSQYTYAIGIGSNVGDRHQHCQQALAELQKLMPNLRVSTYYETEALLLPNAPPEWNMPFFNLAAAGECSLEPLELLEKLQAIERSIGRQKLGVWAPREIDLDILAWSGGIVREATLCIPHPELLNRSFALRPLADVWPDWRYPCTGENYNETAQNLCIKFGF